jgi:SAM-dependent methyltransferase
MKDDYTAVFRTQQAVDKYERVVYAPGGYAAAVDARQRAYLRRRLPRWCRAGPPVQHDFACGTGRGIRMLDGLVGQAYGYDTSAAMLARARARSGNAILHHIAEDGPLPVLSAATGPVVVTLFRFLLNVSPPARDRAVAFAAQLLDGPDAGLFIVENHGPRHSLRGLGRRRHRDHPWFAELSHRQVVDLLARHGFDLVERAGFALCPAGAYRPGLRRAATIVDNLASRLPSSAVCTDVLYTARRRATPRNIGVSPPQVVHRRGSQR